MWISLAPKLSGFFTIITSLFFLPKTSFPPLSPHREAHRVWGNVRFLEVLESFLVAWSFKPASTHICGAFEPLINRSHSCGCFMCNHGTKRKQLRSQAQCTGSGVIPAIHQCQNPYEIQKRSWHAICSLHHRGLRGVGRNFFLGKQASMQTGRTPATRNKFAHTLWSLYDFFICVSHILFAAPLSKRCFKLDEAWKTLSLRLPPPPALPAPKA